MLIFKEHFKYRSLFFEQMYLLHMLNTFRQTWFRQKYRTATRFIILQKINAENLCIIVENKTIHLIHLFLQFDTLQQFDTLRN